MVCYQELFDPDRDAGGYVVTFPDFGYGVTQGETIEEGEEMAGLVEVPGPRSDQRGVRPSQDEFAPRAQIPAHFSPGVTSRESRALPGLSRLGHEKVGFGAANRRRKVRC